MHSGEFGLEGTKTPTSSLSCIDCGHAERSAWRVYLVFADASACGFVLQNMRSTCTPNTHAHTRGSIHSVLYTTHTSLRTDLLLVVSVRDRHEPLHAPEKGECFSAMLKTEASRDANLLQTTRPKFVRGRNSGLFRNGLGC